MSRDWTQEEIQAASAAMVQAGNMSYEEVCAELNALEKIGRFAQNFKGITDILCGIGASDVSDDQLQARKLFLDFH